MATSVANGIRIEQDDYRKELNGSYAELIGVFIYLANTVLPDISFSVGKLSRY